MSNVGEKVSSTSTEEYEAERHTTQDSSDGVRKGPWAITAGFIILASAVGGYAWHEHSLANKQAAATERATLKGISDTLNAENLAVDTVTKGGPTGYEASVTIHGLNNQTANAELDVTGMDHGIVTGKDNRFALELTIPHLPSLYIENQTDLQNTEHNLNLLITKANVVPATSTTTTTEAHSTTTIPGS